MRLVHPIPALELQRLLENALAHGCDVTLTISRDGQEHSVRVRNRQVIEMVEPRELSEAA